MRRSIPVLFRQTRRSTSKFQDISNRTPVEEKSRHFDEIFSGIFKGTQNKSDIVDVSSKTISYKKLIDQKTDTLSYKRVEEALQDTITYMSSIDNSFDLLQYCTQMVQKFDSKPIIGKLDLDAIKSNKDPSTPLLNQFTFPLIMKHGLLKLNEYKSPLDAITLFESLKSKSLPTFIAGCGIKNYNMYIELQWSCFQDITKILNILEDIKINGIQGDSETFNILTNIKDEYRDLLTTDTLMNSETFIWSEKNEQDLQALMRYIQDLSLYSNN